MSDSSPVSGLPKGSVSGSRSPQTIITHSLPLTSAPSESPPPTMNQEHLQLDDTWVDSIADSLTYISHSQSKEPTTSTELRLPSTAVKSRATLISSGLRLVDVYETPVWDLLREVRAATIRSWAVAREAHAKPPEAAIEISDEE